MACIKPSSPKVVNSQDRLTTLGSSHEHREICMPCMYWTILYRCVCVCNVWSLPHSCTPMQYDSCPHTCRRAQLVRVVRSTRRSVCLSVVVASSSYARTHFYEPEMYKFVSFSFEFCIPVTRRRHRHRCHTLGCKDAPAFWHRTLCNVVQILWQISCVCAWVFCQPH